MRAASGMIEHVHPRSRPFVLCRTLAVAVLLLCAGLLRASAQGGSDTTRPAGRDTLRVDSTHTAIGDSARSDSAHPAPPAHRHLMYNDIGAPLGSLAGRGQLSDAEMLDKRALVWERYLTANDALANLLPAYPAVVGGPGDHHAFLYAGASPEAIAVSYNGQPLWDADGHQFDLELYPMEFLERVEILRGARAALGGSGESLIALNFVEPRYDVQGSYVRLWYAQAPNTTTNADIGYARNLGSNVNLALGFRRFAGDGVFPSANQKFSSWSGRGALRWDAAQNLSLSLTEIYSDHTRGASGGLTDASSSSTFFADVLNDTLTERQVRHDLTIAARWYPEVPPGAIDSGGRRMADTGLRLDASLYAGYARRDLLVRDSVGVYGTGGKAFGDFGRIGARAGVVMPLGPLQFSANGSVARIERQLWTDAAAMMELDLGGALVVRGVGKFTASGNQGSYLSWTAEGVARLGDSTTLRATLTNDIAVTDAAGSDTVAAISYQVRRLDLFHTALLAEAEADWRDGRWRVNLNGFYRTTMRAASDAVLYGTPRYAGLGATFSIPIGLLTLEHHLIATFTPAIYREFPVLYGNGDLHCEFTLFEGNLNLRLGTTLEYMSGQALVRWNDIDPGFYALRDDQNAAAQPPFPLWGAYAQARIGSAFIRAEIRNILGAEFETVQRYPTFGRGFYLGANWALVD